MYVASGFCSALHLSLGIPLGINYDVKVQSDEIHPSAGGGVQGGVTYGETDEFGYKVVDKPVEIYDLHATMLHLLGFDHEQLTYRYSGRDMRLTDVHGHVLRDLLV